MSTIAMIQIVLSLASAAMVIRMAYRRGWTQATIERRAVEACRR